MLPDQSLDRKRILFLTPQLPYPPEQGRSIRNCNLIAHVAQHHDVSLLSFGQGSPSAWGPLAQCCRILRIVPPPSRSTSDRIFTLLTTPDPDMAHRLWSSAFGAALRDSLKDDGYDIVQIEGIELAPYAEMIPQVLGEGAVTIVFDDHNAEYVLQRRAYETDLRHPGRWPAALYSLIQWRRLARFERQVCRQADVVLAASEADAEALRALVPGLRPVVVPNGVDTARYHPGLPDALPLKHPAIVFTGKMDFRPNIDAMLWFHRRVWPLIRAGVPQATLYVVGKSPHRRLAPLFADPGVMVTGYVPDILPYFGGADVYIVPLRVGGGTRLKVLEAMAAGLPLVSTTLGAEGITLVPGKDALLADTPEDFAEAVVSLSGDPLRRQRLGDSARALVLEHYDWRHIVPRLERVYATL